MDELELVRRELEYQKRLTAALEQLVKEQSSMIEAQRELLECYKLKQEMPSFLKNDK